MAEYDLPKVGARVRFSHPAPQRTCASFPSVGWQAVIPELLIRGGWYTSFCMKTVTIYSTPTCHFCQMTKEYLAEHNIPFTEHNVANDLEKRQEMIDKSGQMGVPVVLIDDELIVGFDKRRFDELLIEESPAA